jgi:hypothetical protein
LSRAVEHWLSSKYRERIVWLISFQAVFDLKRLFATTAANKLAISVPLLLRRQVIDFA